jgi:hypothetical protein
MHSHDPPARTTRPRVSAPLVVIASTGLLGLGAIAALIGQLPEPPVFAAAVLLAAVVPWRRSHRQRTWGIGLAYGVLAWALFGMAPFLTIGEDLGGPYGGSTAAFAFALVAAVLRIGALSREAACAWTEPRWVLGATATPAPALTAVRQALLAPVDDRARDVERALVSLAATPPDVVPRAEDARRAFFIDVYNLLVLDARRGRRSTHWYDVLEPFRIRYEVAGRWLSPNEIEHGLLRAGARPPGVPWRAIGHRDPCRAWAVPLDPRFHFALNCGATSCPPIRVYSGGDFDAKLELAASGFVQQATELDEARRAVTLSRLFDWYVPDFGGREGALRFVGQRLDPPKRIEAWRVAFSRYDWTPRAD